MSVDGNGDNKVVSPEYLRQLEERKRQKEVADEVSSGTYLTPTQERILRLLSDGLPHTREEIHSLLPDELSSLQTIQKHISGLRKKIGPGGYGVELMGGNSNRDPQYRLVRLLSSPYR